MRPPAATPKLARRLATRSLRGWIGRPLFAHGHRAHAGRAPALADGFGVAYTRLAARRGDFGSPLTPSIKGLHRSPLKPASGTFASRDPRPPQPSGCGAAMRQGRLRSLLGPIDRGRRGPGTRDARVRGWREAAGTTAHLALAA